MGKLEQKIKERIRKTKINRAILTTLAITVAGLLNPQGLVHAVLKGLKNPKNKRRASQNAIYAARGRLAKSGHIEYVDGFWRITEKGKRSFELMSAGKHMTRPKKWDKKWRILIFDIREERKTLRNKVRTTLIAIGFKRLQDSVWVYPYECEDFVALLKADFKIGKDLLYIIADTIENDAWLVKEFGLV